MKITGNPADPLSRGRLCPRGTGGIGLLYDPDRLKEPLVRVSKRGGDRFERATWDAALIHSGDLLAMYRSFGLVGGVLMRPIRSAICRPAFKKSYPRSFWPFTWQPRAISSAAAIVVMGSVMRSAAASVPARSGFCSASHKVLASSRNSGTKDEERTSDRVYACCANM